MKTSEMIDYIYGHIDTIFEEKMIRNQIKEYIHELKQNAQSESKDIQEQIIDLSDKIDTMIKDYQQKKEIEHLKKDVKSGLNHLVNTFHKVTEDIKDIIQ